MALHPAVSNITKSYGKPTDELWANTEIVNHRGTVIAFAQTTGGNFYYTVLNLNDPEKQSSRDVDGWSANPERVQFPTESTVAGAESISVQELPARLKNGAQPKAGSFTRLEDRHPYLATTASLSVPGAPFAVISDGIYICLFRQSTPSNEAAATILMDRFNFDGKKLAPKIESRYQRSRNRTVPQNAKDTLGFKDLNNNPFFEPTHRLDYLIPSTKIAHFAVALVPTLIPDEQNWQFFTYDESSQRIDAISVPRGKDGLFDTRGKTFYVSKNKQNSHIFSAHPGVDPDGVPLVVWNCHVGLQHFSFRLPGENPICYGMHAVVYARQKMPSQGDVQGYGSNAKPVLGEQRLLLAIAHRTEGGEQTKPYLITLDFGVSPDGRLANSVREHWIASKPAECADADAFQAEANAEMDQLVNELPQIGSAEDVSLNEQFAANMAGLHSAKSDCERELKASLDKNPHFHEYMFSPYDTSQRLLELTTELTKRLGKPLDTWSPESPANRNQKEFWAHTENSLRDDCLNRQHDVHLFINARPDNRFAGDYKTTYAFKSLESYFDSNGNILDLSGQTFEQRVDLTNQDIQDKTSAAYVDSHFISVTFWDDYVDTKLGDELFTVQYDGSSDDSLYVPSFDGKVGRTNDRLSAIVIRPNDIFRSRLQEIKETRDQARILLEEYDALHYWQQIQQLNSQIQSAHRERMADRKVLMPTVKSFPKQQMTIDGGISMFAWTEHPPRLFSGADGNVSLLFRGDKDQFFVAYYDVNLIYNDMQAKPTAHWIGNSPGLALYCDNQAASSYNKLVRSSRDRLTIEAWIRPILSRASSPIVHEDFTVDLNPGSSNGISIGYNILNKEGTVDREIPLGEWSHLAIAYRQSHALKFAGGEYVDCGADTTLNILRDLTIEISLECGGTVDAPQRILYKGEVKNGKDTIAYDLYLDSDRTLHWRYSAGGGTGAVTQQDIATSIKLRADKPTRLAVVRQYVVDQSKLDAELQKKQDETAYQMDMSFTYFLYRFYVDGQQQDSRQDSVHTPKGADGKFIIGADGDHQHGFTGIISEVRVWNKAVDTLGLHAELDGSEAGLISWWQIEENKGYTIEDSKSNNHGTVIGATWVENPDPSASTVKAYVNGFSRSVTETASRSKREANDLALGGPPGLTGEVFSGELEEIRIWNATRTEEEIQDNLFRRVDGGSDLLAAYYDCEIQEDMDNDKLVQIVDKSGNHCDLRTDKSQLTASTAPIGTDAPMIRSALAGIKTPFSGTIESAATSTEYGDLQIDALGNHVGVQKRVYGFINHGQWQLVTGFKVGDLETEWIGQRQFKPQVIGFIEGAPPVPSENLTEDEDGYSGASSVKMNQADATMYAIGSSQEKTFHIAFDAMFGAGVESESEVGLGASTSVSKVEIAGGLRVSTENSWARSNEVTLGFGENLVHMISMSLTGFFEDAAGTLKSVGRRFVPENYGYAVVQSDTVDLFALRLKRTGSMVSVAIRKNPDIPRDWNILTFPINPYYVKQGTLDGKVGHETDDDYPAADQYSPDSSYFKPIEAYQLKRAIELRTQAEREKYAQFDTAYVFGRPDLPQVHKRDIVNTYVWTADGGFFEESTETIDSIEEVSTGSFAWDVSAGAALEYKVIGGIAGAVGNLEIMAGGGITTAVTKSASSETAFSLEVEVDLERDIYQRDDEGRVVTAQGRPQKRPGKVDAYRFMTFYLSPNNTHLHELKEKIVDPQWLASNDLNAVAMRDALDNSDARPWRVMHRVTFISRVLPEIVGKQETGTQRGGKLTINDTIISSNYELIRRLEPFVIGTLHDYTKFQAAVTTALQNLHLELHGASVEDIVNLVGAFYELFPVEGNGDNGQTS